MNKDSINFSSNKQFKAIERLIEKVWGSTTSPRFTLLSSLVTNINKKVWVKNINHRVHSSSSTSLIVTTHNGNVFEIKLVFNDSNILKRTSIDLVEGLQ